MALQFLQFEKYKYKGSNMERKLSSNSVMNLTLDLASSEQFKFHVGVEGFVWSNTIPDTLIHDYSTMFLPQWSFYIHRADGAYSFGDPEKFSGEIGFGLFPYKYNPQVRNLGEYLFRSGTYPGWLINNFDWTAARLSGLRFGATAWDKWHNDFMLTTELEMVPFYDFSFSWISSVQVGKVLDIGAGVSLARFLPSNDNLTTPKAPRNAKEITNIRTVDNGVTIDTLADTAYYTYKGTKLMGRLTFNPKGFFGDQISNIFGEEDGKIYFEAAVLGLENQGVNDSLHNLKAYYDTLSQRIPVMIGFNVPVFKLLDVLSLEAEYYKSPYPDDYGTQLRWMSQTEGTPVPAPGVGDYLRTINDIYTKDSWKWSVYAKRSIGSHFAIIGQAARDHLRTRTSYLQYADGEAAFVKSNQWYWALKAVTVF